MLQLKTTVLFKSAKVKSSQNKPQYQVYLEQLEKLTPIQEYRAGECI